MILGVKVLRFVKSNAALIPERILPLIHEPIALTPNPGLLIPGPSPLIPDLSPTYLVTTLYGSGFFPTFCSFHMLWKLKWTRWVPIFSSSRKWRELINQFHELSKATSTRVSIPRWSWNRQCVMLKFWKRLATAWFRSCRQFFCRPSTITTWNDQIFISL